MLEIKRTAQDKQMQTVMGACFTTFYNQTITQVPIHSIGCENKASQTIHEICLPLGMVTIKL